MVVVPPPPPRMNIAAVLTVFMMFAVCVSSSSISSLTCRPEEINSFVHDLRRQCPTTISFVYPIEMDGVSLDKALISSWPNSNVAILFYASWCPFSSNLQSKFAALSSMFPQIKHISVEQSSALPSVFSRYGVHSVPSVLMVTRSGILRHHGPKNLHSLVYFYKKSTGLDPVLHLTEDQITSAEDNSDVHSRSGTSLKEIYFREPYLVLSLLFLFLKAFLYLCPAIMTNLAALWATCIPHLNLAIFGESKQILGRVLHVIDVKRVFSKLKVCKSRNFHRGARNARVWASSLASVSLGETSSARASQGAGL